MFEILKNAKLLILPAWVCDALEAHEMKPADIVTKEGLESILSPDDVRFYHKQVDAITCGLKDDMATEGTNPIQALIDSLTPLHTNYASAIVGGSVETPTVNFNALYGKTYTEYDFFNQLNMVGYLPRYQMASLTDKIRVDPYVELASVDLFVMKFDTNLYSDVRYVDGYPERPKQFVKNTLDLLMGNYGFEKVMYTKLFELYTLIPINS